MTENTPQSLLAAARKYAPGEMAAVYRHQLALIESPDSESPLGLAHRQRVLDMTTAMHAAVNRLPEDLRTPAIARALFAALAVEVKLAAEHQEVPGVVSVTEMDPMGKAVAADMIVTDGHPPSRGSGRTLN